MIKYCMVSVFINSLTASLVHLSPPMGLIRHHPTPGLPNCEGKKEQTHHGEDVPRTVPSILTWLRDGIAEGWILKCLRKWQLLRVISP